MRVVRARPRLFLSIVLGVVVGVFLPVEWRVATRALAAWDVAIGLYLVLAFQLMTNCDHNRIKLRSAHQDEGRITILVLVVASALASLIAILAELGGAHRDPAHLVLAAVTILLSWAFTHTIFALHYAHEYYDEKTHKGGGLDFPGEAPPDYWDFMYFSLILSMACQTSDVQVTARHMRRLVLAHSVMAFFFNVIIIALTINVLAAIL